MPEWNQFITRYAIDPEDLPIPHGVNIVVIESLDTEQYNDKKGVQQTRHRLWLAGWKVPLRLNNTRCKILQGMFGPHSEDAIGKKIALTVAANNVYGEVEAVINIHPFVPDQAAEPAQVPSHLGVVNMVRLEAARYYGVKIAPAQRQISTGRPPQGAGQPQPGQPHPGQNQPGQAAPRSPFHGGGGGGAGGAGVAGGPGSFMADPAPSVAASGTPIGPEGASALILLLRERGRTWDWLAAHMRGHAMGNLVAGELPCDADQALRGPAWSLIKDLPRTIEIPDRAAAKKKLIESWLGPGGPKLAPAPEVQAPRHEPLPSVGGAAQTTPRPVELDPNDIPF